MPRTLIQPNGDTLHCFVTGDEFYNYLHDTNGYTIVQDVSSGYYVYAVRNNNVPERPQTRSNRNRGHINNLVIFIRFYDDVDHLATPYSTVMNMFNDSTAISTNSMYSYFKAASYNQLSITSTFYPAPRGETILSYQDNHPRAYYMPYSFTNTIGYSDDSERASREFALLAAAVNHVSSSVPSSLNIDYDHDGYVDNVCFVIKGNVGDWNDLLWPHRWALYDQDVYINSKRVYDFNFQLEGSTGYFNSSVLCHEMFHTLGAPDLYHYYDYTGLHPVGSWDLMESNTTPPQHSGAYMKYKYGNWLDSLPMITEQGSYSLKPVGSATSKNIIYAIETSDPDQYYILEYRNTTNNFESGLPGTGLLIYRVDMNFHGNSQYDGASILDEVYLFRPGGTSTANGTIANAHFSQHHGRTAFNSTTSPYPFLHYYENTDIGISNIVVHGDSVTFQYGDLPSEYTITAMAELGGTISPSGNILVTAGDSLQLSITADPGFHIDDILIDNISVGSDSSYTFRNVSANHTIKAFFAATNPELTVSADTLWFTTTPVGLPSDVQVLTITHTYTRDSIDLNFSNTAYQYSDDGITWMSRHQVVIPNANTVTLYLRYNPEHVGNSSDTLFIQLRQNRNAYHQVVLLGGATNRTFTVTTVQSTGGTINPAGVQVVDWDDSLTFRFTPDSGYIVKWIYELPQMVTTPGDTVYTIHNIREDFSITAAFIPIPTILVDTTPIVIPLTGICAPISYQVTSLCSAGGMVDPSGILSVEQNTDITINIIPDQGYQLGYLLINGILQENFEGNNYTFNTVESNHTLFAYFMVAQNITQYEDGKLSIYPNPAHNTLQIRLTDNLSDSYTYSIYDLQGRLMQFDDQIPSESIDISNLPQGVYLIRIIMGDRVTQGKFVKN
ncbi:MAG: M6 family metalloprotease domain-containing protein [Bacteroidales bacterium]|nr:M6 family metalloprotease domain-containing protein [Bacteroidales bacterium]